MELYEYMKKLKTTKEVVTFLQEVRAVLEAPGAWSQGAEARTEHGIRTNARDADACCFCLTGAVKRALFLRDVLACDSMLDAQALHALNVTREMRVRPFSDIEVYAKNHNATLLGPSMLQAWNDEHGRTCADVLELIGDTITRLSA